MLQNCLESLQKRIETKTLNTEIGHPRITCMTDNIRKLNSFKQKSIAKTQRNT